MKRTVIISLVLCLIMQGLIFETSEDARGERSIPDGTLITGKETWTALGGPYIIGGTLTIKETGELTIEPGVSVLFDIGARIISYGKLNINGRSGGIVTFASNNIKPAPGDYEGLYLYNSSEIHNLTITHSKYGINTHNIQGGVVIDDVVSSYNSDYGLFLYESANMTIRDITVLNSDRQGAYLFNSHNVSIKDLAVINSEEYAFFSSSSDNITLVRANLQNINSTGCRIYKTNNMTIRSLDAENILKSGLYSYNSPFSTYDDIRVNNSQDGVYLYNSNNALLSDLHITNTTDGVIVSQDCSSTLINRSFVTDSVTGLDIDSDSGTALRQLVLEDNGLDLQIDVEEDFDLDIDDSNVVSAGPVRMIEDRTDMIVNGSEEEMGTLLLVNTSNILAKDLDLYGNGMGVFVFRSDNTTIANSRIHNNSVGVGVYSSRDIDIIHNDIRLYGADAPEHSGDSGGVYSESSDRVNCTGNTVRFYYKGDVLDLDNQLNGIRIEDGDRGMILGNRVVGATYGVLAVTSRGTSFEKNEVEECAVALVTGFTENVTVLRNHATGGKWGLYDILSTEGLVRSNTFTDFDSAVILGYVNHTLFVNNVISDSNIGLNITEDVWVRRNGVGQLAASNNTFFYNVLKNLSAPLEKPFATVNNSWNNEDYQGNYWSDYGGADDGSNGREEGDGIGDTDLPHQGVDDFPFVEEFGWLPDVPTIRPLPEHIFEPLIRLSWNSTPKASYYNLQYSYDKDLTPKEWIKTPSNHTVVELNEEGTVYFRVGAFSEYGSKGFSDLVSSSRELPPPVPVNLSVKALKRGRAAELSWDPVPDPKLKEYEVFHSDDPGPDADLIGVNDSVWTVVRVPKDRSRAELDNLTDEVSYNFTVRAVDIFDRTSEPAEAVTASPRDSISPERPPSFSLDADNLSAFEVRFDFETSPSGDVVRYDLYRSNDTRTTEKVATAPSNATTITDTDPVAGDVKYALTCVDAANNTSPFTPWINVSVPAKNRGAKINLSFERINMTEDESHAFDLNDLFSDPDGDELHFSYSPSADLSMSLEPGTGNITITPRKDLFGEVNATFYANDTKVNVSATVLIAIEAVNDPPVIVNLISPSEGEEILWGSALPLDSRTDDPDLPGGASLEHRWETGGGVYLGSGSDILVNTSVLSPGSHRIVLEVTDDKGSKANASRNIVIISLFDPVEDDEPVVIEAGENNSFVLKVRCKAKPPGEVVARIGNSSLANYISFRKAIVEEKDGVWFVTIEGVADLPMDVEPGFHNGSIELLVGGLSAGSSAFSLKVVESSGVGGEDEGYKEWFWLTLAGFIVLLTVVVVLIVLLKRKGEVRPVEEWREEEDGADAEYEEEEFEEDADIREEDLEPEDVPAPPAIEGEKAREEDEDWGEVPPEPEPDETGIWNDEEFYDEIKEEKEEELPKPPAELPKPGKKPEKAEPAPEPTAAETVRRKGGKGPGVEKEAELAVASSSFTCRICFGVVKTGLPIVKCRCGKHYHQSCAERVGECPACDFDYGDWDALKEDEVGPEEEDDGDEGEDEEEVGREEEESESEEEVPPGKFPKEEGDDGESKGKFPKEEGGDGFPRGKLPKEALEEEIFQIDV